MSDQHKLNPVQRHIADSGQLTLRAAGACSGCGRVLDAHTDTSGVHAKPAAGDLTVCLYCATPAMYDETLQLVAVPAAYVRDPDLRRIVRRCAAAAGIEVPEAYR